MEDPVRVCGGEGPCGRDGGRVCPQQLNSLMAPGQVYVYRPVVSTSQRPGTSEKEQFSPPARRTATVGRSGREAVNLGDLAVPAARDAPPHGTSIPAPGET